MVVRLFLWSLLAAAAVATANWRGGDFTALWLTPDQRGRLAYERLDFPAAAERFEDLMWKGTAQYAAGQYAESAATFGRLPSAIGFFNRGNALMKAREYRNAISSYELAVEEDPDWADAKANLELARYVLAYLEEAREGSDTGGKLGADDVVFDNEAQRGEEMVVTENSVLEKQSAEKWMRSVDTQTRDFLRSRFQLESLQGDTQ